MAIGIVDVKSYYIETPIEYRVARKTLPAICLLTDWHAPDCGLSQTARWAARRKLQAMCAGVAQVRREI